MFVAERLYTAEEFWALSAELDHSRLYELVEGVIVEMPRPGLLHGAVVSIIISVLRAFIVPRQLGLVTTESGFILHNDPDVVRGPDVAFVAADRIPAPLPEGWLPFAPDLAVEVVSPNDSAEDIQQKIEEYLRAGTRAIWVFYPKARAINVHRGSAAVRLSENDTLDGGDILPGFTSPIRDFFP
ncbi:MAG: Uma2 family endonuclease [Anaerolineae bacterium]|nr:Uma2 family endonuclease [Anaerolineae bacterium]NUQ04654.1 Uma2 family endonuclease [Anaerolineae bacterium]